VTDAGAEAVAAVANVSRETSDKLAVLVDLIRRWNAVENLVSPADLPGLWSRHVADCAQLPGLVPDARRWLDIGSGAGLPGLVIALIGPAGTTVDLVESNQRKCAFLRQAIRATGAPATVHQGRAEAVLSNWTAEVDCFTARAVAPLDRLLALSAPVLLRGGPGLFPKGRGVRAEIADAALNWEFDLVQHPSRIDPDGTILEIRNLRKRTPATRG
jgi:16S rRNA (guanine527-N7)-methyltransferase